MKWRLTAGILLLLLIAGLPGQMPSWRVIPPDTQQTLIKRLVSQLYQGSGYEIQVDYPLPVRPWTVQSDIDSVGVRYRSRTLPRGSSIFTLQAWKQGRVIQQKSISCRVRLFQTVLVLSRSVQKGDTILSKWLIPRRKEITDLRDHPLSAGDQKEVWIATRFLTKGTILTRQNVHRPYLVRRGDSLDLLYQKGPIRITLRVRALQNGYRGDTIWFLFPDTRKRISGKIASRQFAVYEPKR